MKQRTIREEHINLLNHLATGNTFSSYLDRMPGVGNHTLTNAVRDAMAQIDWLSSQRPQYPRAFYKWTPEEDERLLEMDAIGTPAWSISNELMRSKQSVSRRLEELKDQQGGGA